MPGFGGVHELHSLLGRISLLGPLLEGSTCLPVWRSSGLLSSVSLDMAKERGIAGGFGTQFARIDRTHPLVQQLSLIKLGA
ncbi:hypothetical protein HPP92_017836 [Vanilla planifolia]|uniref:Uncharacterized protein n=1 Tax=Vanilla planifolia TaxID=51239 RepID=A0A835QBU7_VANPL|nr:hypothetical protein HPP92_017836 [Vanilla planifolia]